jgi:uncharacterized protein HemX
MSKIVATVAILAISGIGLFYYKTNYNNEENSTEEYEIMDKEREEYIEKLENEQEQEFKEQEFKEQEQKQTKIKKPRKARTTKRNITNNSTSRRRYIE